MSEEKTVVAVADEKDGDTIKVFVFGILKSTGGAFHSKECISYEKDTLPNHSMYSVSGSYPASVKEEGSTIQGEMHIYPRSILRTFDMIEGYSPEDHDGLFNLYTREDAITGNGHEVQYYLFNHSVEDYTRVEDGLWKG